MTVKRYNAWSAAWLITDDMLNCSECHAGQFMVHQRSDFVHGPTCPRRGPNQRPYLELLDILESMLNEFAKPRRNRKHNG